MVFLTLFCLVSGVLRCAVGLGKPCCNLDGCDSGVCEREHFDLCAVRGINSGPSACDVF